MSREGRYYRLEDTRKIPNKRERARTLRTLRQRAKTKGASQRRRGSHPAQVAIHPSIIQGQYGIL